MTFKKKKCKGTQGENQGQGQIREERGNLATQYVIIIDLAVHANLEKLIFEI